MNSCGTLKGSIPPSNAYKTAKTFETGLNIAGCVMFAGSGIAGIIKNPDSKTITNNALVICGAAAYAAAAGIGWMERNNPELLFSMRTNVPLVLTAAPFLTYGVKQYVEGGPAGILSGTVAFSAAIVARMLHHYQQEFCNDPNIVTLCLGAHYACANAGAAIFAYYGVKGSEQEPSIANPAVLVASGAALFLAAKTLGGILALHQMIAILYAQTPESKPLNDPINGA